MSSWDQADRGEKLDLVWRNRKKISQIIDDYLFLLFFLLIILWLWLNWVEHEMYMDQTEQFFQLQIFEFFRQFLGTFFASSTSIHAFVFLWINCELNIYKCNQVEFCKTVEHLRFIYI